MTNDGQPSSNSPELNQKGNDDFYVVQSALVVRTIPCRRRLRFTSIHIKRFRHIFSFLQSF